MNPFDNKVINKKNNLSTICNIILIALFVYLLNISSHHKYAQIQFKTYVKDCNNLKIYNKIIRINEKNPYLSIGIPAYNMEKYIEKSLLNSCN